MDELDLRLEELERHQAAERAAARQRRRDFLDGLLGADLLARQAPPPLQDFDTALCEHAAQLAKAVRHMMGDVLDDDASLERRTLAVGALTKMIQANIAIAKTLDPDVPTKTIQGVRRTEGPQD
ncbi:MAG: hypothetical protein WDN08_05940 [Rhizomicrobium sp.]